QPIRGGTRGGQAEFKWSDVSADKDRENYLGHSVNAPTGRWQKNKDVHWYNRDVNSSQDERAEEIRKIKEAEADALAVALGFAPAAKTGDASVPSSSVPTNSPEDLEKAERRRKKADRKEEKRAKKEQRRLERESRPDGRGRRDHSRSRSPARRVNSPQRSVKPLEQRYRDTRDRRDRRSHSPPRRSRSPPLDVGYSAADREQERERDRQRWAANLRRKQVGQAEWGRR
ncbi:kinase phosphorylation protein-domain-containing protein, partial [Mycena pura]